MIIGSEERYVFGTILVQSWIGLTVSGLFYGWGALSYSIDLVFSPESPEAFSNQHGTFTGVIILVMSVIPMVPLRLVLDRGVITEFQAQLYGLIVTVIGLFIGGIALNYKILWLLYVGCAVPCGVGSLMVFQRLIFNHQLWFKRIGQQNLGSGLFGFGIGLWTAVFFLVSIPLLKSFSVGLILYIYAAVLAAAILWPLLTIEDDSLKKIIADEKTRENDPPDTESKSKIDLAVIQSSCGNFCEVYSTTLTVDEELANDVSQFPDDNGGLDNMEKLHDRAGLEKLAVSSGLASLEEVGVGADGMFDITYCEALLAPQTWFLFAFFALVLTPGWGIKLASFSMLRSLFNATSAFSAQMTSLYVAVYAFGRLFSGILAQKYGLVIVYDFMVIVMIVVLILIPQIVNNLDHSSQQSVGCKVFLFLICVLGLMVKHITFVTYIYMQS